jgi:hypothetical protein
MNLPAQERDAILRHAITQVKPDYFSWPIEEQEKYRVAMPPDEWFRIVQIVLRSLFQIDVATEDELDTVRKGFNNAQHSLLSGTLQSLCGIGEGSFSMNESLGDKTLLDFPTLYDYDVWDHQYQEEARKKEFSSYIPKAYRGSLYASWARLFIDGRFYYATLSMVAGYLHSSIEEAGYGQLLKLIPHNYVDGERHGQRTQSGTTWDRRIDAGGRETQLEELRRRFWTYLENRYEKFQQEFDASAGKTVWVIDRSAAEQYHVDIVFSDKAALQHVRLRHFMGDCRSLHKDAGILAERVERERMATVKFLDDNCQDR